MPLASFGKPLNVEGQNTGLSGETAMKTKLIPGAIVILLVSWLALDAVVAILV